MTHLDLFSGIGGFALAAQTVWGSDYHCVGFCEIDSFCQQVLRKNFEGVRIYGDIRGLTAERLAADTEREGYVGRCSRGDRNGEWLGEGEQAGQESRSASSRCHQGVGIDLLTGGFPCQPFSTAGKRKGTEDDRFLWPEMLRVIREVKPRWVISENVDGLLSMVEFESDLELDDRQYREEEKAMGSSGVGEVRERRGRGVLDEALADLEGSGYDVQVFTIPACGKDAPHRRDRVWIVAHATDSIGGRRREGRECRGVERIRERGQNNSMPTEESSCRPSSDSIGTGARGNNGEAGDEGRRTSEDRGTSLRQEHGKIGTGRLDTAVADASPNADRSGSGASEDGIDGDEQAFGEERQQSQHECGRQDCPSSDTESGQSGEQTEPEGRKDTGRGDWETTPDTSGEGLEGFADARDIGGGREIAKQRLGEFPESRTFPDWSRDWREVAFESCVRGVDDGLPRRVARLPDGTTISESKWRQEALKCYGNAIVPQVAMEIMRAIKAVDEQPIELKEWNA